MNPRARAHDCRAFSQRPTSPRPYADRLDVGDIEDDARTAKLAGAIFFAFCAGGGLVALLGHC